MSKELENYLQSALSKLEKVHDHLIETQGFNQETEKLKMLIELTKEQVKDENSRTGASASR